MWKVFYPDTWFIDFSSVTNTPCAAWPPALPFVSVVHPSTHCPLLSAGEVPVCQHHLLPEPPAAKLQHPQEPDDPAHTSKFNSLWLVQVNKAQQLQIDRPTSPQWTCIPPLSARKPIQKNIFPQSVWGGLTQICSQMRPKLCCNRTVSLLLASVFT